MNRGLTENIMRRLGYSDKQIGKMPADPENAMKRIERNIERKVGEEASGSGSRTLKVPAYRVSENAMRRLGYSARQIDKMPLDPNNATAKVARHLGVDRKMLELASVRYAPRESSRWFIERRMDPTRHTKVQKELERIRMTRAGSYPFFVWLRSMLLVEPGTIVKSQIVKCRLLGTDTYIVLFPREGYILMLHETVTNEDDGTVFRELVPTKVQLTSKDKHAQVSYKSVNEDGLETVLKLEASRGSAKDIKKLVDKVHRFIRRFGKVSKDVTGEHLFVTIH